MPVLSCFIYGVSLARILFFLTMTIRRMMEYSKAFQRQRAFVQLKTRGNNIGSLR